MKKGILVLALSIVASCGVCEPTLIDSRQVRVTTNDFPMMASAGLTNLQDVVKWIASNMEVQSGSCTNWQTNTFSRVFKSAPVVTATWTKLVTNSFIYVQSATPSNCVLGTSPSTNVTMNWIAK